MVDRVDGVAVFAGRLATFVVAAVGIFAALGYATDAVFGHGAGPAFTAFGVLIAVFGSYDGVKQYRRDRKNFAHRVTDIRRRAAAGRVITFHEARIAGIKFE